MYENCENSYNVISKPRFEKPFINTPRNSLNFWRRPQFPFLRRGMMAGRYPRMGFRHFSPNMHRPNSSIPVAIRYPMPATVPPFYIQRTPFYMPPNNKINQPILPATAVNEEKLAAEPNNDTSELNDVWVESVGPGGRIYFYNNRTRQSTWKKPINASIIELNEIKKLARPDVEQSEILYKENSNCMEQQPFSNNNYANVLEFRTKIFPMSGLIFPPNVSVPPPNFLRPPLENIQINGPSCNVRYIIPPVIFPIPFVANNLLPSNVMHEPIAGINQDILPNDNKVECDSKTTQGCLSNTEIGSFTNSEHNLLLNNEIINHDNNTMHNCLSNGEMIDYNATHTQNRFSEIAITNSYIHNDSKQNALDSSKSDGKEIKFVNSANDKTSFSASGSKISLSSSSDLIDSDTSVNEKESPIQCKNEKLADLKSECSVIENAKPQGFVSTESKCHQSSVKPINKENRAVNSRPVSCTPISGTNWCVVWTGDERVFFYNPQHKVSVWERPTELSNRSDVDKMVKTSPLLLGLKPLTKEVRKNSSDHLNMSKKIKKEKEIYDNSDLNENTTFKERVGSVKVDSVQATNSTSEVQNVFKTDTVSHEQKVKMFCDMLVENKVSIFSTWEKEVHKIIFDFRYLLLTEGERKQVFTAFIKKKNKEEMHRLKKEHLSQKEAFISLLTESGVTSNSIFTDISNRCGEDFRFKAIEEIKLKRNLFNQYVFDLKKKDRERENEQRKNFIELLSESNCIGKEWSEVQNILAEDERFKAIHSNSVKENLFKKHIRESSSAVSLIGKEKCINSSPGEVDVSIYLKNQKNEQETYTHAMSNFKAMLEDLIKDSDLSWQAAKKILKADRRWKYSQDLESEKCKELFTEYANTLNSRKKDEFHHLLEEYTDTTEKTSWLDIREDVLKDPRCARFSSSERRCEKEFKEYLRQKLSSDKTEFKQLLKETKSILHKSKSFLDYSNHIENITKKLSQDELHLNLDCVANERKEILLNYIKNLNLEGPPLSPKINSLEKFT